MRHCDIDTVCHFFTAALINIIEDYSPSESH
ncbi:Uncharacterised protein [Serratia grimesii]|jgi:hypothetical protein|nr:Uncharacterised protein [Serratia grimesii]CAI1128862.1 Uncharacterised protein [Serratia grimesii]CUW14053.1 Uncharacterised protein [Serratia grimesii]SMZ56433.1 Uncharacterised protein [Serratia grimesii]